MHNSFFHNESELHAIEDRIRGIEPFKVIEIDAGLSAGRVRNLVAAVCELEGKLSITLRRVEELKEQIEQITAPTPLRDIMETPAGWAGMVH